MNENEIKRMAADLRGGCVYHEKRWSGDTHGDLGGSVNESGTDALMAAAADTIDRLTIERDVLQIEKNRLQDIRQQLESARDEAQRKLSVAVASGNALVADAERYRWLRDKAMMGSRHDPAVLKDGPTDCCEFMFGEELDAAIDAAIAESQP